MSKQAQQVVQRAVEEAQRLNHTGVHPVHLLLALMLESEGIVGHIFSEEKTRPDVVRKLISARRIPGRGGQLNTILSVSHEVATDYRQTLVTPAHLLLVLLRSQNSEVTGVLMDLGRSGKAIQDQLKNAFTVSRLAGDPSHN